MKASGVIVEYNPFHNGHKYHLEMARKYGSGEVIVAVMSGDFLQRGEPAIINKWERTEMALRNGVDVVVELPAYYSTQSAEIFAKGSVEILESLKVEDVIFGSESGDIKKLEYIASIGEDEKFQEKIKEELKRGNSYPTSFANALKEIKIKVSVGVEEGSLNLSPNDILGIEYVKSIKKGNLKVKPIAIKREGAGYHSHNIEGEITSATAIRRALKSKDEKGEKTTISNVETLSKTLPEASKEILEREHIEGNTAFIEEYYHLIRHEIILHRKSLAHIQDIEVGFENKLYDAAIKHRRYKEFYQEIMSKRYTNARLQRILIHILLGLSVEITKEAKQKVPYVRVLGFNEKGREYLKELKRNRDEMGDEGQKKTVRKDDKLKENQGIQIFTNLKNVSKKLDVKSKELLDFNERASKIYSIIKEYDERIMPIIHRRDMNGK